jgi:hypothetical protein
MDVAIVGKVTGKKVYKLKSIGAAAKHMIEIGLAIDRYADYIKDLVPKLEPKLESNPDIPEYSGTLSITNTLSTVQTVNTNESSGVSIRLKRGFNLSDNQQEEFWSEARFSNWSKRSGTSVNLRDMRQALISI